MPARNRLYWEDMERSLWEFGYAKIPAVLSPADCGELVGLYGDSGRFRSRIEMARYHFGEGDYQYFADPLPPVVARVREFLYPPLAAIANRWMEALGDEMRYPGTLAELVALCARHGQTQPTPLLLHYEAGGYNCLHQDLYGEIAFPMQVACMLSRREKDYGGGEFLLLEQRPRAQSRAEVVPAEQGEAIVFTTRYRPVKGNRGYYRVQMRHGVSRVRWGRRYTLGVIFHNAR